MVCFVISNFRDFVIINLFTLPHTNLDLCVADPAEPAFTFLEITQYGHEFFS